MAGLLVAVCTVAGAENLLQTGDAEDVAMVYKWHKALIQNTQDKTGGESSFQGNTSIHARSPELIEIDPNKAYILTGSFKSIGRDQGHSYLGIIMYNAEKNLLPVPRLWSGKIPSRN